MKLQADYAAQNSMAFHEIAARVKTVDIQRRQTLLPPVTLAMLALDLSGYLPALRPVFSLDMVVGLSAVAVIYLLVLLLNARKYTVTASAIFVLDTILFYGVALYLTPSITPGTIGATYFTAGNLYYLLADVLPIFASSFLLDMPWPAMVNIIIFLMNMICIFVLPHDASFTTFSNFLGGPLFLAASVTLGQIVLIVFGIASSYTVRISLFDAAKADSLEVANQKILERQNTLERDIQAVQETHARIANGDYRPLRLPQHSEIFALSVSLNLMVERLAHMSQTDQMVQRLQDGANQLTQIIHDLNFGRQSMNIHQTQTMIDSSIGAMLQFQQTFLAKFKNLYHDSNELVQMGQDLAKISAEIVMIAAHLNSIAQSGESEFDNDTTHLFELLKQQADFLNRISAVINIRQHQVLQNTEIGKQVSY